MITMGRSRPPDNRQNGEISHRKVHYGCRMINLMILKVGLQRVIS